jgi:hypothetical protein
MTIATKLLTIFNKKFTDKDHPDTHTLPQYKDLLLKEHKYVDPIFLDLFVNTSIVPDCNYICRMKYIENPTFVKRVMELRVQEIKKKLVYIKYNIELYKLILIVLQKETNAEKKKVLIREKEKLYWLLNEYIAIDHGKYILSTTLDKYVFLKEQYKLMFKEESPYFKY